MLKNYIKIAWRNIAANKLFTTLNIAGLAIGICVCIVLFAFVNYEFSFDRMYSDSENIYRVNMETSEAYDYETWPTLPNSVGPAIINEVTQVKKMSRLIKDDFGSTASLKVGNKNFKENGLYLADSSLFEMFDFTFVESTGKNPFSRPNSIVISQSSKERLFGDINAIGKIITVNNNDSLEVTGIYADLPKNSVIDCNMVYNIMDSWMGTNVYWSNASYETYIALQPDADVAEVQNQATALIDKHVDKEGQYFHKFFLQPLTRIHLYSADIGEGYTSKLGNVSTVKSLLFLSILVLLIACVNYMNLATANSQKRSKSIGMNKVLGANKTQMLSLFYIETGILVFISILIGYAGAFAAIPLFENITGNELAYADLLSLPILGSLIAIWLLVTIIAGSYPAISMSAISPLTLVKKSKTTYSVADFIRKGLVVFQFAASIILIIAVTVILQQMNYIRNKNLGYNPEGIVAISVNSAETQTQIDHVIAAFKRQPSVESVTAVQSIPGANESGRSVRKLNTDNIGMPISSCNTSGGIVRTMQLDLLAGNDLPEDIAKGDSTNYTLINEKILSYLGFETPEEAVGKSINTELGDKSVVTGVVKNFNYNSLKEDVGGYMYYSGRYAPEGVRTVVVRYKSQNLSTLIDQLQTTFNAHLPNVAFDYEFVDQHVAALYASEEKMANTATAFSILAIFIACLGLFGLSAFTAEARTKEIGVRKVLGATVSGVVRLLTKDFLKLVFVAFLIAGPLAWWLMHNWLLDFAFRTNIEWWVFLFAGGMAVMIALLTISFQAIKAAIANPVRSLRTE